MNRNVIETVMGALVLIIAAVFLYFAYSTSQIRSTRGYDVIAKFDHIEGIREGGDVRISGIKVGIIVSETLDTTSYLAVVKMNIDPSIKLPTDTVAQILSNGLLGDKYMALVPGASDQMISPDGTIQFTQSPMSLESLIGQFLFSSGSQKGGKQGGGDAPSSANPSPANPSPANPSPANSGPAKPGGASNLMPSLDDAGKSEGGAPAGAK